MLTKSIERLEETLDAETAALLEHRLEDQEEFNRRKSQSLLELTRLVRTVKTDSISPEVVARLQKLRQKLEYNHSVVEMNLRAVQEVSDIVSKAIQNAESDGTYSALSPY
ncbi:MULTISPECIES: flagellar protein FlgN [Microvirga]|uniref:flagellar protein FlgN n=1 Tax=Microvirga TaxID=186650 RepID=UPI001D00022A|nr:flagellar protein FlgN [Microvirga lenta]MCB5177738.1 flagellar protein FlgN [Microvirga lenta]